MFKINDYVSRISYNHDVTFQIIDIIGDIAITNPTLSKYLLEDAYAESIYEGKDEVTIDELIKAIRSCDKVSPTKKEELADLILEQYKEIEFIDEEKQKKDNVIKLSFN